MKNKSMHNLSMDDILCTNVHYFYYDTAFFIQKCTEAGFTCTELFLGTPHIFIDSRIIDDFDNFHRLAAKYNLKIEAVHPETISYRYGLCYLDDQWNEMSLKAYMQCVDYAASIGVHRLHTNIVAGFNDANSSQIFERIVSNLKKLVEYAGEKNVKIAVETESSEAEGFICTLKQLKDLNHAVGDERLQFNLNYDGLKATGETIESWMNTFGNKINYIRVSNLEDLMYIKSVFEHTKYSGKLILSFKDDCYLEEPFKADMQACDAVVGKEKM